MTNVEHKVKPIARHVGASSADVWAVLSDGWLFPVWVVGASRMRNVDDGWPARGARLHHSVGNWPALLDDQTEVLEVDPGRSLRLKAHAWPGGAAEVFIAVKDEETGTGSAVAIWEDAVEGPGTLVPRVARQLAIAPRNNETLRRLAYIAEGRTGRGKTRA
ncbi:MAG: Polyketide cyclase / dehydrase and lipid transport [Marmoricola sp.]|nr:Polyketide cyclase / dehydrase and lipid transport [Marmoricola sp.]